MSFLQPNLSASDTQCITQPTRFPSPFSIQSECIFLSEEQSPTYILYTSPLLTIYTIYGIERTKKIPPNCIWMLCLCYPGTISGNKYIYSSHRSEMEHFAHVFRLRRIMWNKSPVRICWLIYAIKSFVEVLDEEVCDIICARKVIQIV